VSAAGGGAPRGLRGAVVWAFTTFQPEAPFTLVGTDGVTRTYATAGDVTRATISGELPKVLAFPAQAKLRPVVLMQDRPLGTLPEYAALKLSRFNKLSSADQQRVRDGQEPALFYLPLNLSKYGLKQENAVDLNSLVRIHRSAIATGAIGYLDLNEIDVLGRRLATFLDIDINRAIRDGVMDKLRAMADQQAAARKK